MSLSPLKKKSTPCLLGFLQKKKTEGNILNPIKVEDQNLN